MVRGDTVLRLVLLFPMHATTTVENDDMFQTLYFSFRSI